MSSNPSHLAPLIGWTAALLQIAWNRVPILPAFCLLALAANPALAAQDGEPAATITHIESTGSDPSPAEILRIEDGQRIDAVTGMDLFDGDELQTGPTTTVKLLFLRNVVFEDKTAIVDPDTHVIIDTPSSIFAYVGRVFMQFAGYFDFKLSDRTLGGGGTEFQVEVKPDGSVELLVIEGDVGLYPFRLPIGEELPGRDPSADQESPQAIGATLTSGESATASKTIAFSNSCQQPHRFRVDAESGLHWAALSAPVEVDVDPGQSRPVSIEVVIGAQGVLAGVYTAAFNLSCLDCDQEPGCEVELPASSLLIQVRPMLQAQPLETAMLEAGSQLPEEAHPAQEEEVRAVLERTSRIIVQGQPSQPAANIVPAFQSSQERAEAFAQARFDAFWKRDAQAFETMGTVYGEWGRGVRALKAFKQATRLDTQRLEDGQFLMRFGRANRQVGNLERADELLQLSLEKDPESASARNERGALYLDWARRAQRQGDADQASSFLENAITFFSESAEMSEEEEGGNRLARSIARVNEAEANLDLAAVRRQQGDLTDAGIRLGAARTLLDAVDLPRDECPQATVVLGESWLEQGRLRLAARPGDASAEQSARADFEQARRQFQQALSAEPGLAPAYAGLAEAAAVSGSRNEAVQLHETALKANPRYARSYARLAELLESDQPQRAQRYRDVYGAFLPKADRPDPSLPRLIGLNLPQVRRLLARGQLKLGTVTYQPSSESQGTILKQSPAPKSRVRPGARVDLVLAGPSQPIPTPKVEGMALEQAVRTIEQAGFKVGSVVEKKSRKPEGSIHDQDPEGGDKRLIGSAIDLEVAASEDPGKTRVPRLEGLDRRQAEAAIQQADLVVGRISQKESRERPGTVIGQDPNPGKKRSEGSRVDLVLAVPKQIKVPGLVKESVDQARRKLREEGLTVGAIREVASCDQLGRVLRQEPAKGERLQTGQPVNLIVGGLGPNPVRVADLSGLARPVAERRLNGQGLRAGRVTGREDSRYRPGTVLEQDPRAGSPLPAGCPVDLIIAEAIPTTIVPNLIGMDGGQAQRSIGAARLGLGNVQYSESRAAEGTVLQQSPPPGSQVRLGTRVSLVIARQSRPATLTMPNLRGVTLGQAEAVLQRHNLRLGKAVNRRAPGVKPGTVIDQHPQAGSQVRSGTAVTLYVSDAPQSQPSGRPDLTVQISQTGRPTSNYEGLLLPVQITISNRGPAPAAPFKNAFYLTSSRGKQLTTILAGGRKQFYLFTRVAIQPGGTQVLRGSLVIPRSLNGYLVEAQAEADSCSGEEFAASHCRVLESNEGNNRSNPLRIDLRVQ